MTVLEPSRSDRARIVTRLWRRELQHYPDTRARSFYLAIVVLAAIMQYYELYVQGSVALSILRHFHMSFGFYVYTIGFGSLVGAFASLFAGLADRWGRANLVAYGLSITSGLMFLIPHAPSKPVFVIFIGMLNFVEGVVLVATPALVRDLSPQVGRGKAMGFWALGPVVGSLLVAAVSSNTLDRLGAWQDQFSICGVAGLVVFVIALLGLRELAPNLRDQIMLSLSDRDLVEARARGLQVERALAQPWRQLMKPDILVSAVAVSVFLLIYYSAIEFLVVYLTTVFDFSQQNANAIGNWLWGADALTLVAVGLLSDRLGVRKPFMLVGAIGAVILTIVFLEQAGRQVSYYHLAMIMSVQAVFLATAYAPWMAGFTETIEKHNPALIATGLAIWGWLLRIVVALSAFVVPLIVTSATPLVDHGPRALAIEARYPQQIATLQLVDRATQAALAENPDDLRAGLAAVGEVSRALHIGQRAAVTRLLAAKTIPADDLTFLSAHGAEVLSARQAAPDQWKRWNWICVAGELFFIPMIFVMAGDWRPRTARERAAAHEAAVRREFEALSAKEPPALTTGRPTR